MTEEQRWHSRSERIAMLHDIETMLVYLQLNDSNYVPVRTITGGVQNVYMDSSYVIRDKDSNCEIDFTPAHLAAIVSELKSTSGGREFSTVWEKIKISVDTYYHDNKN